MKQFLTAVIIVAVAAGAYWWWQNQNTPAAGIEEESMDGTGSLGEGMGGPMMEDGVIADGAPAPMSASISYDGSAFTPNSVTVKKGGTVTWTNIGSGEMWVASAQHPTHIVYAGTSLEEHCPDTAGNSFDQCSRGDSYSFTFDKTGTWYFHDHVNASAFGNVVVVE